MKSNSMDYPVFKFRKAYDFNDVLISPILSDIKSRDDVDISVELADFLKLEFPLMASPMMGIADGKFAHILSDLGGLAMISREYPKDILTKDIKENIKTGDKYGVAINAETEDIDYLFSDDLPEIPSLLVIDTANGYRRTLAERCSKVKKYILNHRYKTLLMSGNVVTQEGCDRLYNAGCDLIRVGIGSGSICSTRNQTGIGIPSITALLECRRDKAGKYKLVMDGGIAYSGDFVKAIAAGANLAMSGKLFAECFEATNDNELNGMASREHMEKLGIPIKAVEGFRIPIKKKHSLKQFVREFGYGIKSAGTYLNARNFGEMYRNATFVEVSDHAIKKGI